MKTSRLAAQAIPCGVAHTRAAASPLSTTSRRVVPTCGLFKPLTAALALLAGAGFIHAGSVNLVWNPNPETDIAGYKLSYGTSPGVHTLTQNTGNVTTATVNGLSEGQTYYFVLRAVNTSGLESDPTPEISHTVPSIDEIPNTGWSLVSASSEETAGEDGRAILAIDGNPDTFWHSRWSSNVATPPHDLHIDLGQSQSIRGFRYLPRQDGWSNGNIGRYEFYVSADGINWGNPVASGTFANTSLEKEVLFAGTVGRHILLRAFEDASGQVFCAVAELSLIQGESIVSPPQENRAPFASGATLATDEDQALAIALSANDPDGDALTWQIVRSPGMGRLSGTAPNLTYTPYTDANGSDSFTFNVSDGALISDTVTVAITVRAVNDAPVAIGQSHNATAGKAMAITLRGTDADGDPLSYEVRSQPTQGTLSGTAPNLTYTPAAGAGGSDSFTFRVGDGKTSSNTATISIAIAAVSLPPPPPVSLVPNTGWTVVFASSEETAGEDGRAINAIDGNPDTFWHSRWSSNVATPPHELQIDLGQSQSIRGFRYLPRQDGWSNGNIGRYEFYVSADGIGWGEPVVRGTFSTDSTEKEVLFADIAGRHVLLRAFDDASGKELCAVAELNLIAGDPSAIPPQENRAPAALAASISTDEDTPVAISLAASDPDGDPLEYEIMQQPSMGSLSGTAPELTYTPAADANGNDSFTFRASDGKLQTETVTVSITVRTMNDAPTAAGQVLTTLEDQAVGILLQAGDKDGDPLEYHFAQYPANGGLGGTPPNLTYVPKRDFAGTDTFSFYVNDGTTDSETATVTIEVTPVNDAPVVMSRMVSTPSDVPLAITLFTKDPDGDTLQYRIVSQPMKGRLSGTAPNLTYTPNPRVSGSDSLSYQVNDGTVNSGIATVFISLTAPTKRNQPPVFTQPRIDRSTGTTETFYTCTPLEGTAVDPDGDLVAYEKSAGPEWLEVAPDGSIGGTPTSDAEGLNTFTIRARDPEGAFSEAVLEIEVTGLPLPWEMTRIGGIGGESTASGQADSLTLTGAGKFASQADSGLFVWQTLTGDGEIAVCLASLADATSQSRIGLMIRESLAADSKHTFIGLDSTGYVRWLRRTKTAGNTSISTVSLLSLENVWFKLSRQGGTVLAHVSTDGNAWTQVASAVIDLGSSSYIGLAVAGGGDQPATAVFNNVSVTP
jgi:regulation of enolase protein 1 (concanavalin A-like superfamily)